MGTWGHYKDIFLGASFLPWSPLSTRCFDVSCMEELGAQWPVLDFELFPWEETESGEDTSTCL